MALQPTTWNPSDKGANVVLSNSNRTATVDANDAVRAVFGVSSGKWYWEVSGSNTQAMVGVANASASLNQWVGENANSWGLYYGDGKLFTNNNSGTPVNGAPITGGTVIGVKLDMDAGTLGFVISNIDKGTAVTGLSGTLYPMVSSGSASVTSTMAANFGQSAFSYTVPSGYTAGLGMSSGEVSAIAPTTQFGTPAAVADRVEQATAIGPTTSFGTIFLVYDRTLGASGFLSGGVGSPALLSDLEETASGFVSGNFGEPATLRIASASSVLPSARVPTAYFAFNQVLPATGDTSGYIPTPIALAYTAPDLAQYGNAQTIPPRALFGSTGSLVEDTFVATGLLAGAFGSATADATGWTLAATGAAPGTALGLPGATEEGAASGTSSTAFGTATAEVITLPASAGPTARFGAPVQGIGNAYRTYGTYHSRLGHPVSLQRFTQDADGIAGAEQFGTPEAAASYAASTTALVARFGQSLLLRG